MRADADLDQLDSYLRGARVLHSGEHRFGGGGHAGSFLAVLDGGVGALGKPGANADQMRMARREAAAWSLARTLGWSDMVSATVVRTLWMPDDRGGRVEIVPKFVSMQVLWPTNQPGLPPETFPDEDLWRAAIFDALIRASDRHPGNWLAVPKEAGSGERPRLKLIDHGHAFDLESDVRSPFYERLRGRTVPVEYLDSIARVRRHGMGVLNELISRPEAEALNWRAQALLLGTLDISDRSVSS